MMLVSKLIDDSNELVSLYLRTQYISDLQLQNGETLEDVGARQKGFRE